MLASIGHLPFVYKQVHWKSLRWLALGVALGTPFGVYCLVSIPVDAMRLIINAVVLILTSMLYCGLRPKNAPTPPQTTASTAEAQAAKLDYVAMMADVDVDDLTAVDDADADSGMDMPTGIEGSETDGKQEV